MASPPQQLTGIFQFPGHNFTADETTITIDEAHLQERPFPANNTTYADLGRRTTSLVLSAIDEQDAESILPLFTALRHLSLQKITIRNKDFRGLPTENIAIQSLQLVDCKITTKVVKKMFKSMESLQSVQITRCSHAVEAVRQGSFVDLLGYLPASVRSLSVYDPVCAIVSRLSFPRGLTYFHLEVPQAWMDRIGESFAGFGRTYKVKDNIQMYIIKLKVVDSDAIKKLRKMKNLQHLKILNSVDIKGQSRLKSLKNLKTLEVHCYTPPGKKNLILTLNDDCLLHLFSFLHHNAFLALALAHPRFHRLVAKHIYPHEEIDLDRLTFVEYRSEEIDPDRFDFDDYSSFSLKQTKVLMKSLEQHATTVSLTALPKPEPKLNRFKKLHTITLKDTHRDFSYHEIPDGITKLYIDLPSMGKEDDMKYYFPCFSNPKRSRVDSEGSGTDSDEWEDVDEDHELLVDLFGRLSGSLTSLTLRGEFEPSALSELKSLRFLRLEDWTGEDLIEILQSNGDHLEDLEVLFDEYALLKNESQPRFSFCPLKSLKVLHLHDVNRRLELKPSDFPSLEELRVSFDSKLQDSHKCYIMGSIYKFVQLKTLFMNYISLEDMLPFKNLEFLGLYDYPEGLELVDIVKHLPNLSKLKWDLNIDFETELRLRTFLIAEKRTLKINNVFNVVMP